MRRKTRTIKIGNLYIGAKYPIAIQSMTKTKTADIEKTIAQIKRLEDAGCELVRLAIRDSRDALALRQIKGQVNLPLVADIHFSWHLALEAIDSGADKIRLNPGNISKEKELKEITSALKIARIPLRIGVNSGSVGNFNSKRRVCASGRLVESALAYIKKIESFKFFDIVVSLKSSSVLDTIEAYRQIARFCDYPLHLGLTATGMPGEGMIKSSMAIGTLLLGGIGDTIRVSLTDAPEQEVKVAKGILEALDLRHFGPQIISCPTCGRCEVDLRRIVRRLEDRLQDARPALHAGAPYKIAIMGCVVNGPGEARQADIGLAFGKKEGLLFKEGRPIKKVFLSNCLDALLKELCSGQKH